MSAKLFWMKFHVNDWLTAPTLRTCSHAAKGVWIDMLCIAYSCEERGVLATAGRAWSDEEIARAVGGDWLQTLTCIGELVEKRVALRNQSGAIYSPRMVTDEKLRRLGSESGKKGGGNPAFKGSGKGSGKGTPKGSSNSDSNSGSESSDSPPKSAYPPEFEEWWKVYPRKEAKGAALKAYQAATRKINADHLLEITKLFAASPKAKGEFVPHAATWLNQSRFEDDPAAWNNAGGQSGRPSRAAPGPGQTYTGEPLGEF